MTRFSHLLFRLLVVTLFLLVDVGTYVGAHNLLKENIGQAEVARLSPGLKSLWSTSRQLQPTRLVGVVEPGRLLNIFLGIMLVVGMAVLNSFIFIALGVTGSLPARFVIPSRNRSPQTSSSDTVGDDTDPMPPWVGRVFNALDSQQSS